MRVAIDTNVFIAAILFRGEASKLLSLWKSKKIKLLMSKEVLQEYISVLMYPNFQLFEWELNYILGKQLLPFIEPIKVSSSYRLVKDDPEDNKFINLAIDGKAKYIISGDKHLLELKDSKIIKILSIKEFLETHKISS